MSNWQKIKNHPRVQKIFDLFRQGLTPDQMALSIAVGALVGVIPMFGVTTVIITWLAYKMKFNLPLGLFFTYAIGPVHLLMILPFIKIGESIMDVKHTLLSASAIKEAFSTDWLQAIQDLSLEVVCGLTGWTVAAIPASVVLYYILRTIFRLVDKKRNVA